MNSPSLQEYLEQIANQLMEHGDSVQILMTVRDGDKTQPFSVSKGNIFASRELARKFISLDESADKAILIAQALKLNS